VLRQVLRLQVQPSRASLHRTPSICYVALIDRLLSSGKRVYVMYPVPELPKHVRHYIFRADPMRPVTPLDYYARRNEFILRKLATLPWSERLIAVDPVAALCAPAGCRAVIDDAAMYFDDDHLSVSGALRVIASALGEGGKMSALRQVLKPSEFAKVTPGLDKAQVRRLLGRPASTQRFELKNEEQWNWRWLHGQATKVFSVTFDPDGRVITTAVVDDPRCLAGRVRAAAPSPPARLDGANSACRPSASSASRRFLKPTPAFNFVRLTQWTLNPAARGFSCHRMRAGIT
jgi:hypothetical protein